MGAGKPLPGAQLVGTKREKKEREKDKKKKRG